MLNMAPKWKARILAYVVGAAFLCVYSATLHKGFFPGEAARQASIALRMEPGGVVTRFREVRESVVKYYADEEETADMAVDEAVTLSVNDNVVRLQTKYVLWRLAGTIVASIPIGGLARRMNFLSAVCGALALMLAFATARAILLFITFHVCPLSARMRKSAAFFSALAGVLALGFSVPFWIAATRFLPDAFETMLIVLAAWLLLKAAIRHLEWPLLCFGLIVGLTTFETEAGVYFLPVWIFFAVRAMIVGDLTDARGWTCLLVGFVIGTAAYLGFAQFVLAHEGVGLFVPMKELFASFKVFSSLILGGSLFEDQSRLINICFSVIPFLAAAAMSIWRSNEDAASSGGFLLFVLACMVGVGLSNLQISPWGSAHETTGGALPTNVYLLISYVAAYLTGQGLLMAGGRFFPNAFTRRRRMRRQFAEDDEDDVRSEEHRDYPVGRILSAFVLLVCAAMAFLNWRIVADWSDPMADMVAREIVSRSEPCTWFASEQGVLDSQIRIHSASAGRRPSVVCTGDPASALPRLSRAVTRDKAFYGLPTAELRSALVSTNTDLFISSWIRIDPQIDRKLMTGDEATWREAGKIAVPFVVGYKTVPDGAAPDLNALAAVHLDFWRRVSAIEPLGPHAPGWLREKRAAIRRSLWGIGRSLAADISSASMTDLSRQVLEAANAIRDEPVPEKRSFDHYDIY